MTDISLNEILENLKNDNTLFSDININELLESIDDDKNDIENKTLNDIIDINIEILKTHNFDNKTIETYCNKLAGYKYIDNLYQLNKGKYIRWINKNNKLTNGAIILDIMFLDNGTNIVCKNTNHKYLQLKFDDCIIFQKLSDQEQMILMAYECLQKKIM